MPENNQKSVKKLFRFDPIVILRDVLRRWYLIAATALMVWSVAGVGAELSYTPAYTTNTTFVVSIRSSNASLYKNLSRTSELATVFTEVLNSSILRETVLDTVGLDSFDGTITAAPMGNTNLLTMRVTSTDPRNTFLVTRAIIENHHTVSDRILGDVALDVLEGPKVPVRPSNAKHSLHTAKQMSVLAAAGVFALLGYLSYSRDTIRSKQEASDKLDCHLLGEVMHEKKYKTLKSFLRHKKNSVLIIRPDVSFHFAESIQKIRRRVEHRLGKEKQVLMVTSVLEDEGKSTIAANLALSFASVGRKTLLIDCDLRKPACYKLLQQTGFRHGVLEVLGGKAALDDALETESNTGLSMLLEKKNISNATGILAGQGMRKLLEEARREFEVIVLDMPPMAVAPDAEAAAALADGAVLVVRQNAAAAVQINRAAASLKNTDVSLFGCVLNNMRASRLSRSGGYGYGQGYSRYGKYGSYGYYKNYSASAGDGAGTHTRKM